MTLATKLRDNKAVCAGAGAVDLAVEKLRTVPERVTKLQGTARQSARQNATKLQENVKEFQEKVDAKDLSSTAVAYVNHLGTRVFEVFDGLAERGKTVVDRFDEKADKAQPTEPAELEGACTEPKAKATTAKSTTKTSTAKKSAPTAKTNDS